jgi:hypothetical protein
VGFFRRKETLNEKLIREAGLAERNTSPSDNPDEPPRAAEPPDVYDPVVEGRMFTSGYGPLPARQGDAVAWAHAPEVAGDEVRFYTLPDGSLIVDEEEGDGQLDALANAVEKEVSPPYVAHGKSQPDGWWLITASRVDVLEFEAPGDEIEVARTGGTTTTTVDGEPGETVSALEDYGARYGDSFALQATRLDGDQWALRGNAL